MTNENRSLEEAQAEENANRFPADELGELVADAEADTSTVVREKMKDAMTPGFLVEFDAAEAERVGAFQEDAVSEADALDSSIDLDDQVGQ